MTPTPVGVQISEDVPVPSEVLVAEGIRVPKDIRVPEKNIRVPEHLLVPVRKKLKLTDPTRPVKMFHPHTPIRFEFISLHEFHYLILQKGIQNNLKPIFSDYTGWN